MKTNTTHGFAEITVLIIAGIVSFAIAGSALFLQKETEVRVYTDREVSELKQELEEMKVLIDTLLEQIDEQQGDDDTGVNPPAPKTTDISSVRDIYGNGEAFLNQKVNVEGVIDVLVSMGMLARSCYEEEECDTTTQNYEGMYLQTKDIPYVSIEIYQNGEQYPCEYVGGMEYDCGSFSDGEEVVLEGTIRKVPSPSPRRDKYVLDL